MVCRGLCQHCLPEHPPHHTVIQVRLRSSASAGGSEQCQCGDSPRLASRGMLVAPCVTAELPLESLGDGKLQRQQRLQSSGKNSIAAISSKHQSWRERAQIRRYVYCDVVRTQDIQRYLDPTGVQTYIINQAKVVFLNHRPQSKLTKVGLLSCWYDIRICAQPRFAYQFAKTWKNQSLYSAITRPVAGAWHMCASALNFPFLTVHDLLTYCVKAAYLTLTLLYTLSRCSVMWTAARRASARCARATLTAHSPARSAGHVAKA